MLLKKKITRMLEIYRIWQKPVLEKKLDKMRSEQKIGNMVFQVALMCEVCVYLIH